MLTLEQVYATIYGDIGANPYGVATLPWGAADSLPTPRIHTSVISGTAPRISTNGIGRVTGMLILSVIAQDEVTLVRIASPLMERYRESRLGALKFGFPNFQRVGLVDSVLRADVRIPFEEVLT